MNRDAFLRLYEHMEWADSLVWNEVIRYGPAADDAFIRESLLHIHLVQRAYLTGWAGGTPEPTRADDFDSLQELRSWGRTVYPEARRFLESWTDEDLVRKDEVLWPDLVERAIGQPPVPIALADMVYQVAAHTAHHRAQVNRRLREIGADPPFIDYVAWAWLGDPGPVWAPD